MIDAVVSDDGFIGGDYSQVTGWQDVEFIRRIDFRSVGKFPERTIRCSSSIENEAMAAGSPHSGSSLILDGNLELLRIELTDLLLIVDDHSGRTAFTDAAEIVARIGHAESSHQFGTTFRR